MGQNVTSASGCHLGRIMSEGLLSSEGLCGCCSVALGAGPKLLVEVRLRIGGGGEGGVPGRLWPEGDPALVVALREEEMVELELTVGMVGKALSLVVEDSASASIARGGVSSVRSITSGSR